MNWDRIGTSFQKRTSNRGAETSQPVQADPTPIQPHPSTPPYLACILAGAGCRTIAGLLPHGCLAVAFDSTAACSSGAFVGPRSPKDFRESHHQSLGHSFFTSKVGHEQDSRPPPTEQVNGHEANAMQRLDGLTVSSSLRRSLVVGAIQPTQPPQHSHRLRDKYGPRVPKVNPSQCTWAQRRGKSCAEIAARRGDMGFVRGVRAPKKPPEPTPKGTTDSRLSGARLSSTPLKVAPRTRSKDASNRESESWGTHSSAFWV